MGRAIQGKVTVPGIRSRKSSPEKIVALTAYDYPTARLLDEAGVDIILVGDSVGNVILGHETTLSVTLDMMIHHTAAVSRAHPRALVVGDMPFLSYHTGIPDAVRNAGRFIQEGGAQAVKIEGGRVRTDVVRALVAAEIPVMGHIGLTPQSIVNFGGYRVQGKTIEAVESLVEDARALEEAGVFAMVIEGVPASVGRLLTRSVSIPTIGIGAGADCDGQILVTHDLLGFGDTAPPRFVRRYADLRKTITEAVRSYASDVTAGSFPSEKETYPSPPRLDEELTARR